jgi:hypothetical protein
MARCEPVGPEDVPVAEQATDYLNFIWAKDNPGFLNLHTWVKDALLQTLGVLKIWWHVEERTRTETFRNLTEDQVLLVANDPELEIVGQEQVPGPMGLLTNLQLRWREPQGRVCIEPVPPEEYLFLPQCKKDGDPGQGHRRRTTQSDLIAEGFDAALVDELPTADDDDTGERAHRFEPSSLDEITRGSQDRATRDIIVTEWYTRIDIDADGIAELVKVTLGGTNNAKLLDIEPVDEPPFAVLTPILMSHKLAGMSVAELVMDLQEIKSSLTRQMLNSLYLANNPRTWAVDGQVNLDDLLTNRPGSVVRMRQPNMVGQLNTEFVGAQAFPMLDYMDRTLEGRTGVSRMMQGIDPNVLKGNSGALQTATGIAALQSAAQQRVELIARVFAETGVKRAFRLILDLITRYQQQPRLIRLRNTWVPMDPRRWNREMDLTVEVGLGTGNRTEQLAQLSTLLQIQREILAAGGLNGMVTPKQLHNALAKLVELSGLKTVDAYFQDPEQQPQQPPAEQPPDPNMALVQMQGQVEQMKLQLEHEKLLRQDDRERDKLDAEIALRSAELQARYGAQVDTARLKAQIDLDREAMRQQAQLARQQQQAAQQPAQPRPNGAA